MNYYTIDFTNVTDLSDFYQRIIKGLDFPDWCGENPDAIWDLITCHLKTPCHITVLGNNTLPRIPAYEYPIIKTTFDETVKWYKNIGEQVIFVYK